VAPPTSLAVAFLGIAALAAWPSPSVSQTCGAVGAGVLSLHVAGVHHAAAGGVRGVEVGPAGEAAVGSARLGLEAFRTELETGDASPMGVRGTARIPMAGAAGWLLCTAAHGGATRTSADAGSTLVVAAGVGVGVFGPELGAFRVRPHIEARGLGARTSGSILGMDAAGTGFSAGATAGATTIFDRVLISLAGSVDGFAGGLGVTPYPGRALRLGVGYRF
jgi:hypothetical protein